MQGRGCEEKLSECFRVKLIKDFCWINSIRFQVYTVEIFNTIGQEKKRVKKTFCDEVGENKFPVREDLGRGAVHGEQLISLRDDPGTAERVPPTPPRKCVSMYL